MATINLNLFKALYLGFFLAFSFVQPGAATDIRHQVDKPIGNPPNALVERNGVKMRGLLPATALATEPPLPAGEVLWNVNVEYSAGKIFNPGTNSFDNVRLRSYREPGVDLEAFSAEALFAEAPFVGPTITVLPGDTIRINLNNKLPADDPSCGDDLDPNAPHCFNSTNLHSHGLWISPTGNSDNVLIKIEPKTSFTNEWNISADHPAGTFWYHPHLHGSTALQVSSGMAGALIIKGNRLPEAAIIYETGIDEIGKVVLQDAKIGDIDTLLRDADTGAPYPDRLLLFQQIQYACRDANGKIKTERLWDMNNTTITHKDGTIITYKDNTITTDKDGNIDKDKDGNIITYNTPTRWLCEPIKIEGIGNIGDIGEIENYNQLGPGDWRRSGRYTSVNGRVMPTFESTAGKIERWRLIHAGIHATIKPSFRKASGPAPEMVSASAYAEASLEDKAAFIATNCAGTPATQLSLATDGLTRNRLVEQLESTLQPGYREDLLMVFPEPGIYCIIDGASRGGEALSGSDEPSSILGFVKVAVDPKSRIDSLNASGFDAAKYIKEHLIASAEKFMPPAIRETIVNDLEESQCVIDRDPEEGQCVIDSSREEGLCVIDSSREIYSDLEKGQCVIDSTLKKDLWLTKFVPHKSILESQVTGTQTLSFNMSFPVVGPSNGKVNNTSFEVGYLDGDKKPINLSPYKPEKIDRNLVLGDVEEWTLKSFYNGEEKENFGHPFHIHVNPFQIISVKDKNGKELSGYEPGNRSQYARLQGVWKDTLFIEGKGVTIVVRTRYERYIGDFVLHCHILDHEDKGMMQNVRISLPAG